jgi:20S proteasome alpha/beta subunit
MTLINCVYVPTGIVLSGDSRTSGGSFVLSDFTNKIFLLYGKFGVAIAGDAHINALPIEHYLREYEINNKNNENYTTMQFTNDLLQYFQTFEPIPTLTFIICGYDNTEPFVFFAYTQLGTIVRNNRAEGADIHYGTCRSGDTEIVSRLLSQQQYIPPFNVMNIQDALDFSRHMIRVTIDQLRFEPRFPTVGGEIDTLLVQPNEARFIYKKVLKYE